MMVTKINQIPYIENLGFCDPALVHRVKLPSPIKKQVCAIVPSKLRPPNSPTAIHISKFVGFTVVSSSMQQVAARQSGELIE